MSLTPRKSVELFVEPLEARIAPTALITNPVNGTGKSSSFYIDYTHAPKASGLHFVSGATYGVAGSNVYALKLTGTGSEANGANTGDSLSIFNLATGFGGQPFLQATNGTIVAFFRDADRDGQVDNSELIGISMSKGASVTVDGTVHGDIIGNFNTNTGKFLSGNSLPTSQNITGITVNGNVSGNIIAGGDIDSVRIGGSVGNIFSGTAANGINFHFDDNRLVNGSRVDPAITVGKIVAKTPGTNVAGPSITGINVISITGTIHSGNGGLHADGGDISDLQVQNDVNGFSLLSGKGGNGNGAGRAGQGGGIENILVKGVIDPGGSVGLIKIASGAGGKNSALNGGDGGTIAGVAVGYDNFDFNAVKGTQSVDQLNERILIQGGDGGIGRLHGGTGGSVNAVSTVTATADDGNTNTAEIRYLSGNGGASTLSSTGRGGDGGAIDTVDAENLYLPTGNTAQGSILIQAGNGAASADGGGINQVTVLGNRFTLQAGNGSNGFSRGGGGGSVDTVNVLSSPGIFAQSVTINAGIGGNAVNGSGGDGGNVTTLRMVDVQLTSFTVNDGSHGNAGNSASGVGGVGGGVSDFIVNDGGAFLTRGAPVSVRTGNGGSGSHGGDGGQGGDLSTVQITATDIAYTITTGNGGSVTSGNGNAGAAGNILNLGVSNQAVDVSTVVTSAGATLVTRVSSADTATVTSGNGGRAAAGLGGAGGDVNGLSLTSFVNTAPLPDLNVRPPNFQPDNFVVTTGNGSSGKAGVGKGGDLTASGLFSAFGAVSVRTGNAGSTGGAAADGGLIDGLVTVAFGRISMTSGNGGAGGNGGDITNSGTNLVPVTQQSIDLGGSIVNNIILRNNRGGLNVRAGHGSASNGAGGNGGNIENFSGFISQGGTTSITAGKGGGGNVSRSGEGGSVDLVKLTGVNNANILTGGSTVTIDAGDAGASTHASAGSNGGGVSDVTIFNTDPGTLVHHIAAGNASHGSRSGGAGGSVDEIHVGLPTEQLDIGYRSGHVRGYASNQAGGIFAGLGASGGSSNGAPGDVTNVTAAAIASIVAGKGSTFGLANTVDNIQLIGNPTAGVIATSANSNGSFKNFDTANLVGSVVDPTVSGASTFNAANSGLIAAVNLTENRNFTPEALETLNASNVLYLVDYRQPSGKPVVTRIG